MDSLTKEQPDYEPLRKCFSLEELEDMANTYMRIEYGLPKDMTDEEAKDRWRERFGLLLHFVQYQIWGVGQ